MASPQGSRSQLTVAGILSDADDSMVLTKQALVFLQHFITSQFDDVHDLQPFLPGTHTPESVEKTEVVPMRLVFRDEKYVTENVAILRDLARDANLTGHHHVRE